jgi:hypothetical protein
LSSSTSSAVGRVELYAFAKSIVYKVSYTNKCPLTTRKTAFHERRGVIMLVASIVSSSLESPEPAIRWPMLPRKNSSMSESHLILTLLTTLGGAHQLSLILVFSQFLTSDYLRNKPGPFNYEHDIKA